MAKKTKKRKNYLLYLLLIGFVIKFIKSIFSSKKTRDIAGNITEFAKKEETEIKELATGKENLKRFCCDSGSLIKDYFIPHNGNDHKPKILHTRSLATIGISVLLLKLVVTGYLFFMYPNQAYMSQSMVNEIFELTNRDRTANKVPTVVMNNTLSLAASAKAQDMIDKDYFAHYSPDGKKPWEWINRTNYAYLFVGENLAMNFSSANSAHTALMNSESHKKNILNDRYNDIGLAIISGEINDKQTNVLVELFATRQPVYVAASEVVKEETPEEKIAESLVQAKAEAEDESMAAEESVSEAVETSEPEAIPANDTVARETEPEVIKPVIEDVIEERTVAKANNLSMQETETIPAEKDLTPLEVPQKVAQEQLIARTELENNPSTVLSAQSDTEPVSPNEELENHGLEVVTFHPNELKKQSLAIQIVNASRYVLLGILAIMSVVLLLNIVIRISVQHKSVIIETMVLLLFIAGLVNLKLHFIERMAEMVAII